MRVINNFDQSITFNSPILTIGTYDGVHIGHQKIISTLVEKARESGRESVLLTFHPHPRKIVAPNAPELTLIDSQEEKLRKLEQLGLDTVILYPFTIEFSQLTAEDFVRTILVDLIKISEVWVGYDHQFGKNRSGDFQELVKLGEKYRFNVHQIDAIVCNETIVSSTKIRSAIRDGEIEKATEMLGTPFTFVGKVYHGKKLGRTIGFPTANLMPLDNNKIIPKTGVYCVTTVFEGVMIGGVMNIGFKPTVTDEPKLSIEVYLFEFNQDIYDRELGIAVHYRLRDELKFDSLDQLIQQISYDVEVAHNMLASLI